MLFLLWCFPLFVLIIKHWMPRKGKEKNGEDLHRAIVPIGTQALGPSL